MRLSLIVGSALSVIDEHDFATEALQRTVALAEGLGRTIVIARALVDGGRTLDLTGIDDNIGALCAKALNLPPTEGREIRLLLFTLREEVHALSAAIRDRGDEA